MGKRKRLKSREVSTPRLSSDASHSVEFFMRPDDGAVPSLETFASWPNKAAGKLLPVLAAVAEAPPTKFDGGGRWEAMHGTCTGDVRGEGEDRRRFEAEWRGIRGEPLCAIKCASRRILQARPKRSASSVSCPGKPGCAIYLADLNLRICFQAFSIWLERET